MKHDGPPAEPGRDDVSEGLGHPPKSRLPSRSLRDGRTFVKVGNTKVELVWCRGATCDYGNKLRVDWLEDGLCRVCREKEEAA